MTDIAQQQAIHHVRGPCITIAGPGAGKTFCLVRRIAYMTESCRIPPSSLLVITFTKAAAVEMRERYQKVVRPELTGVTFGTFHSIFFGILRKSANFSFQSLIDTKTKEHIIRTACLRAEISVITGTDFYNRIAGEISYIKNKGIDPDSYDPSELTREEFKALFNYYEKKKQDLEKIDFDDMLIKTLKLLEDNPVILEEYRNRFKYIMVDEAQDTNGIQYDIIRMLALPDNNLFIVGDDDQAIYSFRGSQPKLFLDFCKDYPDAKKVILSNNYRCDRDIVKRSLRVIENNTERYDKNLNSMSSCDGKIRYMSYISQEQEAKELIKLVLHKKRSFPKESVCILCRNRNLGQFIVKEAEKVGLNINGRINRHSWYESEMVTVLENYFNAAVTQERDYHLRIINIPQRYLPRRGLEDRIIDYRKWKSFFSEDTDVLKQIDEYCNDITAIRQLPSYAAAAFVMFRLNVKAFLEERGGYSEEAMSRFLELARENPDKRKMLEILGKLKSKKDNDFGQCDDNALFCYTFHGSKGLEFDHVFIIDANEGITPSRYAETKESIEEERRLFYVAMTRARHTLTLSSIQRRGNEILYPSRFLREIEQDQSSISSSNSSNASETRSASSSDSMLSITGVPSSVSK